MNRKYRIPLSFCMAAIWIFLIYRCAGIFFETNDDRLITEIFSGAMTGSPEAHAYYVNYILGFLLSSLYRLTTAIPWYGGMLVLFQFLCWFFTSDAFFSRARNKRDILFSLVLIALLYAAGFYIIANIQFTSTAAALAITGYLYFLLCPNEKSRCVIFSVLELFSFLLRSDAMLMIQPMGGLVLFGFYCSQHIPYPRNVSVGQTGEYSFPCLFRKSCEKDLLSAFRPVLQAVVISTAIVIIGTVSHYIFYSSTGWKEYEKVNDAVTELTDYAAIPDYTEVQPVLEKYHVTEKQYNAFLQYAMIEENLSGDCLLEIAEIAHAQNTRPSLSQVFREFLASYTTREYWSLNLLLLSAWTVLLIYMILTKTFFLLLPLAGLFIARSALWLYLLYEGRVPPRVMFPLYLGEIAFLFCLFFMTILKNSGYDTAKTEKYDQNGGNVIKHYLPVLLVILLLPFGAKTLKNQYLYLSAKNTGGTIYFRGMQDMIAYCNNHPEKHYFIDASALIYYRGSAFETKIYGRRNGVITGCWYSGAPVLYRYEKDYFSDCDTIYLLTSSDMEMQSAMVIAYLEERLGSSACPEDTFIVSNGGKYIVYSFSL